MTAPPLRVTSIRFYSDYVSSPILDVSLAKPTDKNLRAKKMARFAQRQQQFGGWGYGNGCHGGYGGYHQQAHYADCLKQCILGYSNLFIKYDLFYYIIFVPGKN